MSINLQKNPIVVVAVLVSLLAGTLLLAGYVNKSGQADESGCCGLLSGTCGVQAQPTAGCCGVNVVAEQACCAGATCPCTECQPSCGDSTACKPNDCTGCGNPDGAGCCAIQGCAGAK